MIILRDSATITDKKVWEIYTKIKSENIQYQELENYYLQWYKLRQEDKNPEKLAWIAKELGEFYLENEQYGKAFHYFEEFMQLLDEGYFTKSRFWLDHAYHFYRPHENLKEEYQKVQDAWFLKYYQKAFEASKEPDFKPYFLSEMTNKLNNYIRHSQKPVNQDILTFLLEILEHRKLTSEVVWTYLLCARKSQNSETTLKYMEKVLNHALKIKDLSDRETVLFNCAMQYEYQFKDYAKCFEIKLKIYESGFYDSEYEQKDLVQTLNYACKDPVEMAIMQGAPASQIQNCIRVLDNFLENYTKNQEKIWAYRLKSRLLQHQKKYKLSALERIKIIPFMGQKPMDDAMDLADAGFLFQLARDKTNALKYFEQAIEVTRNHYELNVQIPKYILKKAYCLEAFKDIQNAEKEYLRAFNLAIKNLPKDENHVIFYDAHLVIIYDLTWKISQFYEQKNNKPEALKFAKTSLEITRKIAL